MVLYIGHTYSSERGGRNAVKILSRIYNVLINQTVSHWHMCECASCLYVHPLRSSHWLRSLITLAKQLANKPEEFLPACVSNMG